MKGIISRSVLSHLRRSRDVSSGPAARRAPSNSVPVASLSSTYRPLLIGPKRRGGAFRPQLASIGHTALARVTGPQYCCNLNRVSGATFGAIYLLFSACLVSPFQLLKEATVHHTFIPTLALTGIGKKFESRRSWFQREREEDDEDDEGEGEEEDPSATPSDRSTLWALKDISFSVARGERVAIIGANGSGKSILLKIVGGLCLPTEGTVWGRGCVIPLNSILKPFQSGASGLSNLQVMCQILRIERKLLDERIREIVAFAELKGRLHDPVSSYSRAMYERLAAAAVLHLEPGILLIDDGFSAGDHRFREKLDAKLQSVIDAGAALLNAGHQLSALGGHCDRAIWLDRGRIRSDGPAKSVIAEYEDSSRTPASPLTRCA